MLTFDDDTGTVLKDATGTNYDDEVICLAKTAQRVRQDMQQKLSVFTGIFKATARKNLSPSTCLF